MKLYLGTNTKMYKTRKETVEYIRLLKQYMQHKPEDLELFVIPSFTSLESAQRELEDSTILLGAQNVAWEERGAYTGEISPLMLKETGVQIAEIGHSERRHLLGETDEQENKKVLCALRNDLKVLLCIGETEEEKMIGQADAALGRQLIWGLKDVLPEETAHLMIAYEPVWAIGVHGKTPEIKYVRQRHEEIRQTLCDLFQDKGREIPLLYGGSVNQKNATELISLPEVNGLFIGRSAWDASNFNQIILSVYECWKQK